MDLGNVSSAELRKMLDTQQGHLTVIGLNFNMNGVRTAKQAQKYDRHSIGRIKEVIDRILAISDELRKHALMDVKYHPKSQAPTAERQLHMVALAQYHPVIQKAFLSKLKSQGDVFSAQWAKLEKQRITQMRAEAKLRTQRARFNPKRR